jgi:hypothetical protein
MTKQRISPVAVVVPRGTIKHRTRGLDGKRGSAIAMAECSARPVTSAAYVKRENRISKKRKARMNPDYLAWIEARS